MQPMLIDSIRESIVNGLDVDIDRVKSEYEKSFRASAKLGENSAVATIRSCYSVRSYLTNTVGKIKDSCSNNQNSSSPTKTLNDLKGALAYLTFASLAEMNEYETFCLLESLLGMDYIETLKNELY